MGKLVYSAITSLDGYIEDDTGAFAWCAPDEEVLACVNELERPIGTYLYGRRMYETLVYWETAHTIAGLSAQSREFTEIWQAADKIVYSTTLEKVSSTKTRLERAFDPKVIGALKEASDHDISIGGSHLAGQALRAGLVDACQLFVNPVVVGGGKSALPDGVRLGLELIDVRRFSGGVVLLDYAVGGS